MIPFQMEYLQKMAACFETVTNEDAKKTKKGRFPQSVLDVVGIVIVLYLLLPSGPITQWATNGPLCCAMRCRLSAVAT